MGPPGPGSYGQAHRRTTPGFAPGSPGTVGYDAVMGSTLRRIGLVATIAAIVLITLPATVAADCTPACGEAVEQGLDALGVMLLVAVLTLFVAVMTVGGRIVGKDRRSSD